MILSPDTVIISLTPLAVLFGVFVNSRASQKAMAAAEAARRMTLVVAKEASSQSSAIIVATQNNSGQLAEIAKVGQATHVIVNNQKTIMLDLIAQLTRRIANDNPDDLEAQSSARSAEEVARHHAAQIGGNKTGE